MIFKKSFYLLPLFLFLVIGCSDASPVTGTVKLADGTPLTAGYLMFESATTNVVGDLDSHGHFSLYQFKPGDHVPPGTYRGVVVFDTSLMDSNDQSFSKTQGGSTHLPFPQKYTSFNTSGLTVTVEPKKPVKMDIVLD